MSGAALHWVGEFLGLAHPAEDAAAPRPKPFRMQTALMLIPAMVGLGAPLLGFRRLVESLPIWSGHTLRPTWLALRSMPLRCRYRCIRGHGN